MFLSLFKVTATQALGPKQPYLIVENEISSKTIVVHPNKDWVTWQCSVWPTWVPIPLKVTLTCLPLVHPVAPYERCKCNILEKIALPLVDKLCYSTILLTLLEERSLTKHPIKSVQPNLTPIPPHQVKWLVMKNHRVKTTPLPTPTH